MLLLLIDTYIGFNINVRLSYLMMLCSVIYVLLYKIQTVNQPIELKSVSKGIQKRYESSRLEENDLKLYIEKLENYFKTKKPYLDSELTLQSLSEKVGIPKHHITQVLNTNLNKNFYQYVNEYRINEVITKLQENSTINIMELAYSCGFNSKSTFNNYFKKATKKTPREFKKELQLSY